MTLKYLALIVATPVLFILLDFVWLSLAGGFFKNEIGSIARLSADGVWNIRYIPALLVYVCMTLGMFLFVLPHATSFPEALAYGAVFGFVSYGIYDLTNLATLSAWTWRFAVVDILWGTILCATVTACLYFIGSLFS